METGALMNDETGHRLPSPPAAEVMKRTSRVAWRLLWVLAVVWAVAPLGCSKTYFVWGAERYQVILLPPGRWSFATGRMDDYGTTVEWVHVGIVALVKVTRGPRW
jgi:hypothetical protein